jgi:hypothetical protein
MPPRALLGPTLQGLVLCAVLLIGAHVPTTPAAGAATSPNAVPLAAQALATRLGLTGAPVLGDQPQGYGGPWALWLTKVPVVVRTGSGRATPTFRATGRILSAGPQGAEGAFAYFSLPSGFPNGQDPYHGPPLAPARAIRLVVAWLRHAGAPVPSLPPHVQVETPGSTVMGGTGLCCFTTLAVVSFYAGPGQPGPPFTGPVVAYVADAGAIVQVNVATPPAGGPTPPSCDRHLQRESNAPPIGPSCFSDQAAAHDQLVVDIGGHEPWHANPSQIVRTFAFGRLRTTSPTQSPVRVITSAPDLVIAGLTAHGMAYRFTLVPAFPGLPGSVWRLVAIDRHVVPSAAAVGSR